MLAERVNENEFETTLSFLLSISLGYFGAGKYEEANHGPSRSGDLGTSELSFTSAQLDSASSYQSTT